MSELPIVDLLERLRVYQGRDYCHNKERDEAADAISAQRAIIRELVEALEKAKEYVGPEIYKDGPRQSDCERCDNLINEIDAILAKAKQTI